MFARPPCGSHRCARFSSPTPGGSCCYSHDPCCFSCCCFSCYCFHRMRPKRASVKFLVSEFLLKSSKGLYTATMDRLWDFISDSSTIAVFLVNCQTKIRRRKAENQACSLRNGGPYQLHFFLQASDKFISLHNGLQSQRVSCNSALASPAFSVPRQRFQHLETTTEDGHIFGMARNSKK